MLSYPPRLACGFPATGILEVKVASLELGDRLLVILVLLERGSALGYITLPLLAVVALPGFIFGVLGVRSVAVLDTLEERLACQNRAYVGATLIAVSIIAFLMLLLGLLQVSGIVPESLKTWLYVMTGWYV